MAMKDLIGIIVILIILWFVWFFTGGQNRPGVDKPFIKPASPIDTGEKYGPQ